MKLLKSVSKWTNHLKFLKQTPESLVHSVFEHFLKNQYNARDQEEISKIERMAVSYGIVYASLQSALISFFGINLT